MEFLPFFALNFKMFTLIYLFIIKVFFPSNLIYKNLKFTKKCLDLNNKIKITLNYNLPDGAEILIMVLKSL